MTADLDVAALIAELTLDEKASLCSGSTFWHTQPIERVGIPAVQLSDGPHGLRKAPAPDAVGVTGSLPATCFPTGAALGSSWNTDLAHRIGVALGEEARAQGVAVLLGPGINIKRSPLCGRNFEYLSEDPVLSGELAAAWAGGVQSQGVGVSVKHFAANNQEQDRQRISAEVDERTLREIYLAGFERVVRAARPWTVMCSYNRVNGVPASENRWLLTEVLREEWGFGGVVISDWGAVRNRVASLVAGVDLEMPGRGGAPDAEIVAAVRAGELGQPVLDQAVGRVLGLLNRVNPGGATGPETPGGASDHHALARAAARECAVLLKNEGGVLPLQPRPGQRLAIIGEFATNPRFQGAGSSQVNPTRVDSPLEALRAAVGDGAIVEFAPGFLGQGTDDALVAEAVDLARRSDLVVAFLGLPPSFESEGFDRSHMDLPGNQLDLLGKIAAVHDNIVVVLANGSAVTLSSWQHNASAILEAWLGGQGVGAAIADLLLGAANPSGRLAETLPRRLQDNPSFLNFPGEEGRVRYGEGVFVGYRYYDAVGRDVSYPFGHGLSYTTFEFSDLQVAVSGSAKHGDLALAVAVTVANTGDRAGQEVAQVYVSDREASLPRPQRELKAFAKVALEPGESKTVRFDLTGRDLSFWSARARRWRLEAGNFDLAVGASSRDIRLTASVVVAGDGFVDRLDATSTLAEWLSHPDGAPALLAAFPPDGGMGTLLRDDEQAKMTGQFTMATLATFGMGFGPDDLARLLEALPARA